jgi:nucleotide-binding universal stress UspA family protein
MYNTILVSLDGSLASEAVLWQVEKMLGDDPKQVILLRAAPNVDRDQALTQMVSDEEAAVGDDIALLTYSSEVDLRNYLAAIALRFEAAGVQVVTEVSFRDPAEEILFYAKHYKADLIAMTTHARVGLDYLFHGSVTESVLRHARCPILIARIPESPLPRFVPEGLTAGLPANG